MVFFSLISLFHIIEICFSLPSMLPRIHFVLNNNWKNFTFRSVNFNKNINGSFTLLL